MKIRDAEAEDEKQWRRLWAGYLDFYEASVPEEVTSETWARILTPGSGIIARLADVDGRIGGFAVSVLHPGTWSIKPSCYLEDLFVDPALRGRGLGRALIDDLIVLGRHRGWSNLYWHTRAGNETARKLYDLFTLADDFVRYRLPL